MDGRGPKWCGCKCNMTSCAPEASAVGWRVNESLFCESCCPVPPSRSHLCFSHAWCPLLFSDMPGHIHTAAYSHQEWIYNTEFCCNKPLKLKQCITMNPFTLPVTKQHLFCCVCWTFCSLSKRSHWPIFGSFVWNKLSRFLLLRRKNKIKEILLWIFV